MMHTKSSYVEHSSPICHQQCQNYCASNLERQAAGCWHVECGLQRQRLDTALIVGDWREDHTQPATTALIEELTLNLNKNQETKQNQLCQNLIWFYVYCLYCPFRYVSAAPRLCSGGGLNCVQQSFKRIFVITEKAFSFTIEICVIKCFEIRKIRLEAAGKSPNQI